MFVMKQAKLTFLCFVFWPFDGSVVRGHRANVAIVEEIMPPCGRRGTLHPGLENVQIGKIRQNLDKWRKQT